MIRAQYIPERAPWHNSRIKITPKIDEYGRQNPEKPINSACTTTPRRRAMKYIFTEMYRGLRPGGEKKALSRLSPRWQALMCNSRGRVPTFLFSTYFFLTRVTSTRQTLCAQSTIGTEGKKKNHPLSWIRDDVRIFNRLGQTPQQQPRRDEMVMPYLIIFVLYKHTTKWKYLPYAQGMRVISFNHGLRIWE